MSAKNLRIIFMGTPVFAVPSLQSLIDSGTEVVAVITQPDRPKGRGRKLTPPPVKELALANGIPVLQPTKIKTDEFFDQIKAFSPDIIVVAAYGRILPGTILQAPRLGAINVHGSLLPKYRGAAPIQHALINGEQETGITIMQMDEGLDTGDILLQGALPIELSDTSASLAVKMAELGGRLLKEALALLADNKLFPQKQDDSLASFAPPLAKEDGLIKWQRSAWSIHCLIRGMDPWPTAYTFLEGKRLRLFAPEIVRQPATAAPGTILQADATGLLIATGAECLLVKEMQIEGGKRLTADAFFCGRPLASGIRLG